ncbi:sensor histidine kinase [Gilvimarinus sp. SDUM040013]|uniref:histidine kinase n=1 Tax=Gilvimarinus gilvus TaxID=3058038 RepID=A0ABU4S6C7_9GAMM|nr:sensor histidine kinase [Gilvimarinus sp. SDUM040013]MDO3387171.1 sensor histidine kinase [Gilvimarinus sp. SDUM040013]MDX6850914.1 sensor histidine kinase [Gilvimarinus sp. SDUM040013]
MRKSIFISRWVLIAITAFLIGGGYFVYRSAGGWWGWSSYFLFVGATLALVLSTKSSQFTLIFILQALTAWVLAFWVHPHLAMLFVVVCLVAAERLVKHLALYWMLACVAAVAMCEMFGSVGSASFQDALINSFLTLFIGGFAVVRKEAENTKLKALELTDELQKKNKQLEVLSAEREHSLRTDERQHLSRELHDTLGHKLTVTIVQLEAAERFLKRDPERVEEILRTARTLMTEGLAETRDMLHLLDDNTAQQMSLRQQLEKVTSEFEDTTGLTVVLKIDSLAATLQPSLQLHLIRIVQEALTNVARHADASEVLVRLEVSDCITLLIEDNGRRLTGREGERLAPAKSIASRASQLCGSVELKREGELTRLRISIPLADQRGGICD